MFLVRLGRTRGSPLKVKEVCICECGTAFRVMKQISGSQPFKVTSITEVHKRYLREGRIKIDKSQFNEAITYHDPCQIARNAGVMDEPRYILKHLTDDFREMSRIPNTTGAAVEVAAWLRWEKRSSIFE